MNHKEPNPKFEGLDIPLPNDYKLEESILAKLLYSNNSMIEFAVRITPEMFFNTAFQRIYRAMLSLFNRNVYIDIMSVKAEIDKIDKIGNIGGTETLVALDNIPDSFKSNLDLENVVEILVNYHQRREIIKVSRDAIFRALDTNSEADSIINSISETLLNLTSQNIVNEPTPINEVFENGIAELEKRRENAIEGKLVGVPTGFVDLDRLTGGYKKSTLTILAARPAMGKTTYAFQSIFTALFAGFKCAFFSLEMSKNQLSSRFMAMQSGVDYGKIVKGTLSDADMQTIKQTCSKNFKDFPNLYIDDESGISITKLKSKCLKIKRKLQGLDFIVVDYLQLMVGDRKDKATIREQEISFISRNLKQLSKEFDVPVIALAQLSREVERRSDKKPQLSDLRESGSLEQDSDMVMFLHRPEYYQIMQDENGNSTVGLAEIIIAKNREGALDTVQTTFIGSQSKFIERVTHQEPLREQPVETYSSFKNHNPKLELTNFENYADNGEEDAPF
jgi:replicative DNA helicase